MSSPHQPYAWIKALETLRMIPKTEIFPIHFKMAAVKDIGRFSQMYLAYILSSSV